jgi:mRNA interferase RelE/StbE
VSAEHGAEPYQLRTTPTVRRALSEPLPETVAAAAYEFTYRIVCRVDDATRTVTVVDVDHRRDVYRS